MSEPGLRPSTGGLAPAVHAWLGPDARRPPGAEHARTGAEVAEWLRPHWARLGITRVADVTGLDVVGVPVATCYRPNARTLSVAQGTGATSDAAVASALMEAVEFAHAERPVPETFVDTIDGIGRAGSRWRVVHPDELPRVAGTRTARWAPLRWMAGVSLLDGEPVAVPADAVRLDHVTRRCGPGAMLEASSNGLAAGSDRAEAVAHALCELVERDAVARWELAGGGTGTAIDPAAVRHPACRELLGRFAAAELTVSVAAVPSIGDLPVIVAELSPVRHDPFRPLAPAGGAGCHLHVATALRRALAEAAQTRLIDIAGVRDDLDDASYEELAAAAPVAADLPVTDLPLADPASTDPASTDGAAPGSRGPRPAGCPPQVAGRAGHRPAGDGVGAGGRGATGDVAVLVGAFAAAGLHPVAVDLTDPRLGVPVVKVVVAGLCGLPGMMTRRAA